MFRTNTVAATSTPAPVEAAAMRLMTGQGKNYHGVTSPMPGGKRQAMGGAARLPKSLLRKAPTFSFIENSTRAVGCKIVGRNGRMSGLQKLLAG